MNDKDKEYDLMLLESLTAILERYKGKVEAIEKIVFDNKHSESVNGVSVDSMANFQRFQIEEIKKILED